MSEYTLPERERAALVTIDAQRDYCEENSPVKSAGGCQIRAPLGELVRRVREQGPPIFHMLRFYRPDGSNVDLCRRKLVEEGMRVLMPGSLGAELIEEVSPNPETRLDPHLLMDGGVQQLGYNEEALYKPRWGAFYATPLEQRLRNLGINTVILCGCNFPTSGRASVLEASERDFRVVLVPEAAAGLTDDGQRELARVGIQLMTIETCLAWLAGRKKAGQAA